MTKGIILLSGGLDSAVLLALRKVQEGDECIALTLSYGQKHQKEILAAEQVAKYYGVEHLTMDVSPLFAINPSASSLLRGSSKSIPMEKYAGVPSTYVPFRNGLFLSAATALALQLNASYVALAIHANDGAGNAAYPDCSEEFSDAMGRAIYLGSGIRISLKAPFVRASKAFIVSTGLRLGVPFHLTWSCYAGGDKPCGTCGTCIDRKVAMAINGINENEGD